MKPYRSGWVWLILLMAPGVQARTMHLYYTDPQGTVLAKTDAQGNILERYDYRPYGGIVGGTVPNGPGYTGHVNDPETAFVYMQARYDDPGAGRFLSPDPAGLSPGDIYSFNRYDYANNNPTVYTDPTGACVGTHNGQDAPCNPPASPQDQFPSSSSPPPVSPAVQRMRDASDRSIGVAAQSWLSRVSVSGLLVGKPSVTATGIAAYGGGGEVVKGLYKADDEVNIITPAVGLSASADVKVFEFTYKASNAPEGPVHLAGGGEFSFHDIVGGRVSVGYAPPSTFRVEIDGGVGAGAAYHIFSVGTSVNSN